MTGMLEKLKARFWYLKSIEVEQFVQNKPDITDEEIISIVLNRDLKSVGEHVVTHEVLKNRNINKVKDVSMSKAKSSIYGTSPYPLLRLALTDGVGHFSALVLENVAHLSVTETPPGSKLLLKTNIPIENKFLLLNNDNCVVLGGHVSELIARWNVNKELASFHRPSAVKNGPPLWVPFGVDNKATVDVNRKTLVEKPQVQDNTEFSESRKTVIQSLAKVANLSKQFNQNLELAPNVSRSYRELNAEMKQRQKEKDLRKKATAEQIFNEPIASYRVPEWARNNVQSYSTTTSAGMSDQMRQLSIDDNEYYEDRTSSGDFGAGTDNRRGRAAYRGRQSGQRRWRSRAGRSRPSRSHH